MLLRQDKSKMQITIENKKLNPFLSREEIEAVIQIEEGETTPSFKDSKKLLSEKINKREDLIIIKKVDQRFGENKAKITAYAYEDADALKKYEPVKKAKGEEKKKEKTAENKAEAKPEKKEETKEEKNK